VILSIGQVNPQIPLDDLELARQDFCPRITRFTLPRGAEILLANTIASPFNCSQSDPGAKIRPELGREHQQTTGR